jgi:Flp pilus assembly protein TadD
MAALQPDRVAFQIATADAWTRSGRPDLAVTRLAQAVERFPEDPSPLVALGRTWLAVARARQDAVALNKAVVALRRAVAQAPTGPALTLLGRAHLQQGDAGAALRALQQATAILPVDPQALGDLAIAAQRTGRLSVARSALVRQAALAGDTETPRVRAERAARIATLHERLGDRAGAAHWLGRALAATPDDRALAARLSRIEHGSSRARAGNPL